jgi:hypothetical protein
MAAVTARTMVDNNERKKTIHPFFGKPNRMCTSHSIAIHFAAWCVNVSGSQLQIQLQPYRATCHILHSQALPNQVHILHHHHR